MEGVTNMNELTQQDLAIIMYALEVYNVHMEWNDFQKEAILTAIKKVHDIQHKY
jgi:hypothetical protein